MSNTKQTIAIIGAKSTGYRITERFSARNYRILLFDKDSAELNKVQSSILRLAPDADVEVIECKHEACWEADMIMLYNPSDSLKEVAEKIRDVSTQKIVIYLYHDSDNFDPNSANELKELLPFSKIIFVQVSTSDALKGTDTFKAEIWGNNNGVQKEVQEIFEDVGFEIYSKSTASN